MISRWRERIVRRKVGDIGWEFLPGLEDHLIYLFEELDRSRKERPPEEFRAGSEVFKVKTNRPGLHGELFVKVYPATGLARFLPFGGRARREWRMAIEHARRGLPSAAYLAYGARGGRGTREEYIIQESLTGFEPLPDYFKTTFLPELPGGKPQDKRRLIRDLASLIRRMHDRGISRPGIEPGNIMAAPKAGGGVNFVFVDPHRSFLRSDRKGFSPQKRIVELARFHRTFSPLFSQSYRLRFYRNYFAPDNLPRVRFQELVKEIVTRSAELSRRDEALVERRVDRREDPFFWFRYGEHLVYLRKPLYQNSLIEVVDKFDSGERPQKVRIKRLFGEPPIELLYQPANSGEARRGFLTSAILEHHGIAHYRVMAAVDGDEGFVLSTVPTRLDYNLAEYLARRVAEEFSGLYWDRKFLIRVSRFMLNLHEFGWYFPAPSGDDIWIRTTEDNTHEARVLATHKLLRLNPADLSARVKNLADLWKVLPISQSDGIMLAEEYLRAGPRFASRIKPWLHRYKEWQLEEKNER